VKELNYNSKEEALTALEKHVKVRNKMCGALWYNVINDECCKIANKCAELGADRNEITKILGEGIHVRRYE